MSRGKSRYIQGRYKVQNVNKYIGDTSKATYRSSWERELMLKFDHSSDVLRWSSEPFHIWYRSPLDGQKHRYFIDFLIVTRDREGNEHVTIIEVKPYAQCLEPKRQGKRKARYINETRTFLVNISKWEAALEHADKRGWHFKVVTEKGTYDASTFIRIDS